MGGGKRPANRSGRLSASAGRGGEEKAADGPVDGREFVEDACAFDFVYAHEMRHVDVHVRRLREVSLQLQSELQNRLAGSTHIGQRDDLERRLKAEIGNYWVPRAERDLKDVRRQHAAIDTPEEYARAQTACDGRVARYLPRLRQAVEAR